jgi:release factor glutamine methyltransferase
MENIEIVGSFKTEVQPDRSNQAVLIAEKVSSGYPLEYEIGYTSFLGYRFFVNESVLIPRPDTEHVVVSAEQHISKESKVLDLCTGSGCISITLKVRNPDITIFASDISKEALTIARKNAEYHNAYITFIEANLLKGIKDRFDIIVTNPPYIPTDMIEKLEKCISYEPFEALNGGEDGMDFYRRIESSLDYNLADGGLLISEIERQNADTMPALFEIFSKWSISIEEDLTGRPRTLAIRRKERG